MTDRFEEFWTIFPRKVAKRAARKEWDKEMRAGTDPSEIISGLKAQLPTLARKEQQFIPHARTWLHQGRWEDEPEQGKPTNYADFARTLIDGRARTISHFGHDELLPAGTRGH